MTDPNAFDIPQGSPLGEVDYQAGHHNRPGLGWRDIDTTRQSDADLAQQAAAPPANLLGETAYAQDAPQSPDRYIVGGQWAPDPYTDLQGPRPYPG